MQMTKGFLRPMPLWLAVTMLALACWGGGYQMAKHEGVHAQSAPEVQWHGEPLAADDVAPFLNRLPLEIAASAKVTALVGHDNVAIYVWYQK